MPKRFVHAMPALLLLAIISVSGCTQYAQQSQYQPTGNQSQAQQATQEQSPVDITDTCVQACKDALAQGRNLEQGPCLLDPATENKDWVCDVAHSPRQDVDNLPENQCSSYRSGVAAHFVEVAPDCRFIRTG